METRKCLSFKMKWKKEPKYSYLFMIRAISATNTNLDFTNYIKQNKYFGIQNYQ